MEIINIEARTFEAMVSRFEQFVKRIDLLCGHKDTEGKILFNQIYYLCLTYH